MDPLNTIARRNAEWPTAEQAPGLPGVANFNPPPKRDWLGQPVYSDGLTGLGAVKQAAKAAGKAVLLGFARPRWGMPVGGLPVVFRPS